MSTDTLKMEKNKSSIYSIFLTGFDAYKDVLSDIYIFNE
jgi:hypothetical protein